MLEHLLTDQMSLVQTSDPRTGAAFRNIQENAEPKSMPMTTDCPPRDRMSGLKRLP
ncbi:protein of unknown function [Nitrospira japonica]|uniref:Uncharacterized protein n=1 Tax=Nitrospira japonica TaxID=1325564 RepID=A0A1W1I3D1_9BACT|nr:protein of unknown function [Nitrospira japonica]